MYGGNDITCFVEVAIEKYTFGIVNRVHEVDKIWIISQIIEFLMYLKFALWFIPGIMVILQYLQVASSQYPQYGASPRHLWLLLFSQAAQGNP